MRRILTKKWSTCRLVVALVGLLWVAPAWSQPTGAQWYDMPGFPLLVGNNKSCVVATHEQVGQCDYRAFAAGPAALQPGVSDQCFRECAQCCGVYAHMSPEDEILFSLTCECLAAAGVTIATEGAAIPVALSACTGARFWMEQIPTLVAALEGAPDWVADASNWEDTASWIEALINYQYLTGDLVELFQRQDAIGEQARALLRRELENPGQFDASRWARLGGGVVDWAGWMQWIHGVSDWAFGFCDALQEHTEEGMGVACRTECYDYFPPEHQPGDSGGPGDNSEPRPNPTDEGQPTLEDFDGPGHCDGTVGDRCDRADGSWGVINAECDCESVGVQEGLLCELDPDPVSCEIEVCRNLGPDCQDPFRIFGGGSLGSWWLMFATQMY